MTDNSRYLCFNLGKEEFAIPLLDIKEVIGMPDVTPIPQAPTHFVGIMNLRGQVISIMDLRVKLSFKPSPSDETSVIILDLGNYSLGVIVDRVNSVQVLSKDSVSEKPLVDNGKSHDYITGVFRKEDKLVLLLEINKALSIEDKNILNKKLTKSA